MRRFDDISLLAGLDGHRLRRVLVTSMKLPEEEAVVLASLLQASVRDSDQTVSTISRGPGHRVNSLEHTLERLGLQHSYANFLRHG